MKKRTEEILTSLKIMNESRNLKMVNMIHLFLRSQKSYNKKCQKILDIEFEVVNCR